MIINIILYTLIFLIGYQTRIFLDNYVDRVRRDSLIKKINDQFKEVLNNILSNKSKFKNRVNDIVYINMKLKEYDDVNVVYIMDRKDIAIFKNNKCIYTSEMVEKDILSSISNAIENKFEDKINDVIEVLGFVLSREYFERTYKNPEKMKIIEESDIDKIMRENNTKFNIDDILDKISKVGINNLTNEEKEFLKNYKI
jgi:Asp-tRNA(Asn)/Glu-tRNA(Gln) amidotransferase A subunit family amidase